MRALQTKAWPACHRCGEASQARCRCTGPLLEVLPDTDRLCAEGYTNLVRPGRFQDTCGRYVQCPVCLDSLAVGRRERGSKTPHCKKSRCRHAYQRALQAEEALRDEWHQLRLQRIEARGRAA